MKHKCIKAACGKSYEENDPDAYYCFDCRHEKTAIAKRIDRKFAGRSTVPPETPLQLYDRLAGMSGKNHQGITFVPGSYFL